MDLNQLQYWQMISYQEDSRIENKIFDAQGAINHIEEGSIIRLRKQFESHQTVHYEEDIVSQPANNLKKNYTLVKTKRRAQSKKKVGISKSSKTITKMKTRGMVEDPIYAPSSKVKC